MRRIVEKYHLEPLLPLLFTAVVSFSRKKPPPRIWISNSWNRNFLPIPSPPSAKYHYVHGISATSGTRYSEMGGEIKEERVSISDEISNRSLMQHFSRKVSRMVSDYWKRLIYKLCYDFTREEFPSVWKFGRIDERIFFRFRSMEDLILKKYLFYIYIYLRYFERENFNFAKLRSNFTKYQLSIQMYLIYFNTPCITKLYYWTKCFLIFPFQYFTILLRISLAKEKEK